MQQGIVRIVSFKSEYNRNLLLQINQLVIRERYVHFIANMLKEISAYGFDIVNRLGIAQTSKNFAIGLDNIILDTVYYYSSNKLVHDFVSILQKGILTDYLHTKSEYIFQILGITKEELPNIDPMVLDDIVNTVRKYIKRSCNDIQDYNIDDFSMNVLGLYSDFYDQNIGIQAISYYFTILAWDQPVISGVFVK